MAAATGIQTHPVFKLGKAAARPGSRGPAFADLLMASPSPAPPFYDFDAVHTGVPTPMFANDTYGDCVIAGRAHQTLRFEDIEQGAVLKISDQVVVHEYLKETGGADVGLVVADSLDEWRDTGWQISRHNYRIRGYSTVVVKDHEQVRKAIYADVGVGLGVALPIAAQQQVQTGQPWDVTTGPDAEPNSWGGHYVFVPGYTAIGPVCVTWGRRQQMTWAWLERYCDEAYAIFDAKDTFKTSVVDPAKVATMLV